MNQLSSRNRKLVYVGCILLLLAPIIYLGAPASADGKGGGQLALKRNEYGLGEASVGDVDPTSSAANLLLLGMRGPAAGVLHMQAIGYQDRKEWKKLETTVDTVRRLQPHYVEIWKFQGWNLAFNVSREWDRVDDRFAWVKKGIKFLIEGTVMNNRVPILFHEVGDFTARKMNTSDEKKFFRQFYLDDPDKQPDWKGSADPELNPLGKDPCLVAREWFLDANERVDEYVLTGSKHTKTLGKTPVFFKQSPYKMLIEYADLTQKEGSFERERWREALKGWREEYGRLEFTGLHDYKYMLNCAEQDLIDLAQQNGIPVEEQRRVWARNVNMTNYNFWSNFLEWEYQEQMLETHRAYFEARKAYHEGRTLDQEVDGKLIVSEAEQKCMQAINGWAQFISDEKNKDAFIQNDSYMEEASMAIFYLSKICEYNGKSLPEEMPLKDFWNERKNEQFEMERQLQIDGSTFRNFLNVKTPASTEQKPADGE
ncbi:MAG: hypothetical protein KDA85_06065 [Planctomycetaceae bacterium]|nr:hypothetical protein [Planctomycetaceae bacterium]